jgi:rubrerythrin
MELEELRFKVIKLMKEVEATTSELYKTYAEKFPEHNEFWKNLAKEEEDHVGLIHELGAMVAEGSASYNVEKFQIGEIQTTLDWIRDCLNDAKNKEISLKEALFTGMRIEDTLVEKVYHEAFDAKSRGGGAFISGIVIAEKRHRDALQEFLDRQGG